MSLIISVSGAAIILFGVMAYLVRRANHKAAQLQQTAEKLQHQIKQQAVEIQQKTAEVKNANISRKHSEKVTRSSTRAVDDQLHANGWFRDTDHHGLHGVSADLPKSVGHSRDQASDTGTQSDLSGDL